MLAKRLFVPVSVVLVLVGAALSSYVVSRDRTRDPTPGVKKPGHLQDDVVIDRPFDDVAAGVEDAVKKAGLIPISSADWTRLASVSPGRRVRTFQFASPAFVRVVLATPHPSFFAPAQLAVSEGEGRTTKLVFLRPVLESLRGSRDGGGGPDRTDARVNTREEFETEVERVVATLRNPG